MEKEIKEPKDFEKIQLEGLKWSVTHAYNNSPFYKKHFDKVGVRPEDINDLSDLKKLPFTEAEHLREDYPFPLLSVPFEKVIRIHASSGTTGKRKILSYTQKDVDDWTEFFARSFKMAGIGPKDRVQIAVGYGLWTAGVGFQAACERVGAMAIPIGPGNLDLQCQFLLDLQPTCICCTSSMALLLGEEVKKRGIKNKINIKTVIQGSERCSEAMRKAIVEHLGAEHLFDITGLTELYGPGPGIDCKYHKGIHYWADYYILEILDPDTLEPVEDGQIGEMVVTTLRKEATPLIRYRTRDLTRKISGPCPCGSPFPRHDRILGRSDDMIIFRGVNIYPGQIDEVLSDIDGISSEYNITLERRDSKDFMIIKIERDPQGDPAWDEEISSKIKKMIKNQIMISPEIQIVDYGALPRSERKSKRIFDNR